MITERLVLKNGKPFEWNIVGKGNGKVVRQKLSVLQTNTSRIDLLKLTRRKINKLLFGSDCSCYDHPFD